MGRVAAPYGVRGWLKVQTLTESVDALIGYPTWWLGDKGRWSSHRLLEGRVHGGALIAQIDGVADRAQAAQIRGATIAVPRAALPVPPDGQYYWSDLVGLAVVNQQGEKLGQVAEIFATGANDVIVVRGERERLIPFVEPVLRAVDLEGGRLLVDWKSDY